MKSCMLETVRTDIREQNLFKEPGTILAAVSGGADSTAMLYALAAVIDPQRNPLVVVHVHHGLRGESADQDAAFVQQTAWSLGLPCYVVHVDVPDLMRSSGLSLEMAARQLRYKALHEIAAQTDATYAALAHNADDQVETVLMRLLRGAGLRGLGGIRPVRMDGGLAIVRPLLGVTHKMAVEFLKSHQLSWREDASNRNPDMLRNRIRHELLPVCEDIFPACRKAVLRTAALLQDEETWRIRIEKSGLSDSESLPVEKLREMPSAECRRMILRWLEHTGIDTGQINTAHVQSIEALLKTSCGTQEVDLPAGAKVRREYDQLMLVAFADRGHGFRSGALTVPGVTYIEFADCCIEAVQAKGILRPENQSIGIWPAVASIKLRPELDAGLVVRNRRPGDWMMPQGCHGRKKLQDIFVDQKVPAPQRDSVPLVECNGEIIWIPGYRVAEKWTVKQGEPALHLRVFNQSDSCG